MKASSIESRFWPKVRKSDGDGCWEWTAAKFKTGYGAITIGSRKLGTKKAEYAHRLSWILAYGEILDGLFVLHKCDNPTCVRPDHLFLGNHKDNAQDMASKNRWRNQYKDSPPTHCKRGHEFTKENTRMGTKGERVCRACAALWAREHKKQAGVSHV